VGLGLDTNLISKEDARPHCRYNIGWSCQLATNAADLASGGNVTGGCLMRHTLRGLNL
jgi:hypothetical protein